jgi:hypothetical protein
MKARWSIAVVGLVVVIGAYFFADRDPENRTAEQRETPAAHPFEHALGARDDASIERPSSSENATATKTELGFRLAPSGDLAIESDTRGLIEELSTVADVSELYDVKDHLQQTMPAPAGQRAAELVESYYQYRIALEERLRHSEMAEVPEDATIALDALKALRIEFFGAELTELWFAEEDAIGREMIAQAERAR